MAKSSEILQIEEINKGLTNLNSTLSTTSENYLKLVKTISDGNKEIKDNAISFDNLAKAQKKTVEEGQRMTALERERVKSETKLRETEEQNLKTIVAKRIEAQKRNELLKAEIAYEKAAAGSIEKLTAENKKLYIEQRRLNLETEQGVRRKKEINEIINKNTNTIKANSSELVQHRINVGNYGSALKGAASSVMHFLGISAGIAGVIHIAKEAIESTEGVTDKFEQTVAALDGATQGFFRTITTGDWTNFIKNMKDSAAAAKELKAAQQELEHIAVGNKISIDELTLKLNELKNAAAEETDPGEKSKLLTEAIETQKRITAVKVRETEMRAEIDEDYYKKLLGQDEEYWNQLIERVPEISKNYEMQFALLDGYKKRLEQLEYARISTVGGLTEAEEKERHYYQLLVYNLEDFKTLQDDLSKKGKWDAFLEELSQITLAAAEGEAALRRMLSQRTRANTNESKANKIEPVDMANVLKNINEEIEKAGIEIQKEFDKEAEKQYESSKINEDRILQQTMDAETDKLKAIQETNDKIIQEEQKKADSIRSIQGQLASDILSGIYDMTAGRLENEMSALEKEKNAKLSNKKLTESQKAKIEADYEKKSAALKTKQAEGDKIRALFQIAIDTIMGRMKARAEFPLTGGLPFTTWITAAGLIEAGLVAAQPIPKYAKGTQSAAQRGIFGEAGRELMFTRTGDVMLADKPTYFEGSRFKGARILSNPETEKMIRMSDRRPGSYMGTDERIINGLRNVEKAIQSKPVAIYDKDNRQIGIGTSQSQTVYLNRLIRNN